MKENSKITLEKILRYCADIRALVERYHNDFEAYRDDIAFQYSCNMCLIQIGELVTRLPDAFKSEYCSIPWRAIVGMRNFHAHDYDNIDLELVWHTLTVEIPELEVKLNLILESL